ncbi:hypothetical protein Hdeb2414_s0026g00679391 [Helianthus debilis subsp. tardiflorus]
MRVLTWSTFPGCAYVLKGSDRHVSAMDVGLHRSDISGEGARTNVLTDEEIFRHRYWVRYKRCNVRYTERSRVIIKQGCGISRCKIKLSHKGAEASSGAVPGSCNGVVPRASDSATVITASSSVSVVERCDQAV